MFNINIVQLILKSEFNEYFKACDKTFVCFKEANPERGVAVLKYFYVAFDKCLLIRIFNTCKDSTFTTTK